MTLTLRGAGGSKAGGGSSHTPVEAPDSLHSISSARILDLISEGQVQGFAHGSSKALQDIYLDGTPLQNADNSLNFKNVQVDSRVGTQSQDYIKGFSSVENETAVGTILHYGTQWTQSFSDLTLSAVRVRLAVPVLTSTSTTTGDISGTSVGYKIELSTDSGAYATVLTGTFNGKTTTEYDRSHRIDLPTATTGWTLRVSRMTVDSTSSALVNAFSIASYTTIVDGKFAYPNSALVSVVVDASQFNQIPVRAYDVKGRIIQVPTNYNPTTRQYSGTWDGTFQSLWTDNPAWIYYDLATNNRYGLGDRISASQIDKWGLYTIAQYCDGYVPTGVPARASVTTGSVTLGATAPNLYTRSSGSFVTDGFAVGDEINATGFAAGNNGRGVITAVSALQITIDVDHVLTTDTATSGRTLATQAPTEPRFTCNVYLQSQADAYKVMQDLATVFRGISYWAAGVLTPVSDMPGSPVVSYSNANIIGGKFTYQGSAKKARHTVALVTWNNPNNFDKTEVEYVPDTTGIARYGIQPIQITAIGCKSQGQAHRVGLHVLLSERLETDIVSFSIGMDGMFSLPGQLIRVADANRAGRRIGGRIESATTTQITIDAQPATAIAPGDTLVVMGTDDVSHSSTVSTVAGNLITVSPAYPSAPQPNAVWIVETASLVAQQYRVLTVADNGDMTYAITALQHNDSKFAAIDTGAPIQVPSISAISTVQAPVISVILSSFQRSGNFTAYQVLEATWPFATGAVSYVVEWIKDGVSIGTPQRVFGNIATYEDPFAGSYVARVSAVGPTGLVSTQVSSAAFAVDAASVPPIDSTPIALSIVSGTATVNCAIGNHFTLLLNANAMLAFIGVPPSDHLLIEVTQSGGSHTLSVPASVIPISGVSYVASTADGAVDVLDLITFNGGGTWRLNFTNASAFTASASPSPASASANSVSGADVSPSVAVTVTPAGGTGGVSHAWARADSGGTDFSISSTTAAAPTFSIPSGHTVQNVTQLWRDTLTDSSTPAKTTSVTVSINLVVTSSGSPPLTQTLSPDVSGEEVVGHYWSQGITSTLSGGTGTGQTWAWSRVSGSTAFALANASSQTCNLTLGPGQAYGTYDAVYQCVANDSGATPVTTTFTVSVNLNNGL